MRAIKTINPVFFDLLKAGLWEQDVRLSAYSQIDLETIYKLAEEQSVIGVLAAGFEHITDMKFPKRDIMPFVGCALRLENENTAMNKFIAVTVSKMREAGIKVLLVKGQGVAQCYARPLWRACGDVDFFMDAENYEKAKQFLLPLSSSSEPEIVASKHFGLQINSWPVELHGALRCGLSLTIDKMLDAIRDSTFTQDEVRVWKNGDTEVLIPKPDNDIVFIFTHFLKHFYKGGIGLRQICDWSRLLWTFRSEIDVQLLGDRLQKIGLTTEWKAFGAFAVDYLGMPAEAMPLYSPHRKWKRKASRICGFILEVGNFGKNRDLSYYSKYPFLIRKSISLSWRLGDLLRHARIFPLDSLRFLPKILYNGVRNAVQAE